MKIAYLNPYENSMENHAFFSMQSVALKLGIELLECKDEVHICSCSPDFVISVTSQLAKMTHHPTYLVMHEPKSNIFIGKEKFQNILTYDGYLTISDSLLRFIADFSYGVGRTEESGFFYLTPQRSNLSVNWLQIAKLDRSKIAYIGKNLNRHILKLLKKLDAMNVLAIHGPTASWEKQNYSSYRGPVAFDGVSPQNIYATCGIGLVLLDDRWQSEDIVSNKIFEILSVGAMAICPDIPWIRKWFGDDVLYFDVDKSHSEMARQIRSHYEFCLGSPHIASAMATRARNTFEKYFSAERMFLNLIDYHKSKILGLKTRIESAGPQVNITVVVRCGGRAVETVARAVNSIIDQTFGVFHIIFAKHRDIDLSVILDDKFKEVATFEEFLIPDGGRAAMLYEELKRVKTEYFAILDDEDILLPNHFETLFTAGRQVSLDFDIAFSGTLSVDSPVDIGIHTPCNRIISKFGFSTPVRTSQDLYNQIHICSLVARIDLLSPELMKVPNMGAAGDLLLVNLLSRRKKPIFSYRATLLYTAPSVDEPDWRADPARHSDEISLTLRSGLSFSPAWTPDEPEISLKIVNIISGENRGWKFYKNKFAQIIRRPSILLGPLAPPWRRFKAKMRARRKGER